MNVEINIDKNLKETKITISSPALTKDVQKINDFLNNSFIFNNKINVFLEKEMFIINLSDIETIYSSNNKVYVKTNNNLYTTKYKLYELEEILGNSTFVRISNSEIVNFDKVKKLDLKLTGTILLFFKSGAETYVSRRYMKKIKEYLNI